MLEGTTRSRVRPGWSIVALVAFLGAAPHVLPAQDVIGGIPDGVCYQVNGDGYIVSMSGPSDTSRVPIGTLSTLVAGDSIVVLSGTITVLDFRTGQRSVFGQGTRYRIPAAGNQDRTGWRVTKERLTQLFSGPEPPSPELGATRGVDAALWPDGDVEFGPDVPIDFQWWGLTAPLSAIRLDSGDERIELPLSEDALASGRLAWQLERKPSGPVVWYLLDADHEPLLQGRCRILPGEQAAAKRARYRAEARGDQIPPELEAVLRALADRSFLW